MSFMGEDHNKWIKDFLLSLGFNKVKIIGTLKIDHVQAKTRRTKKDEKGNIFSRKITYLFNIEWSGDIDGYLYKITNRSIAINT